MNDVLERATLALKSVHAEAIEKDEAEATAAEGTRRTRERVLSGGTSSFREGLGERRERTDFRRVRRGAWLPLAASFALVASLAAASQGALPGWSTVKGLFAGSSPVAAPSPRPLTAAVTREVKAARPLPETIAEPVTAPIIPEVPVVVPSAPRTSHAATHGPTVNPRPSEAPETSDSLYATAHDAHFEKRDPEAALAAWNAYLASAPHGRFAPEAAYNRALCPLRLGRREAAASALRPFADAPEGSYRRAEATKLLEATKAAAAKRTKP